MKRRFQNRPNIFGLSNWKNEDIFGGDRVDWIRKLFCGGVKWGTKEGNEDFSFEHFEFEMSFRYSNGDAESAVGYFRLGFRGEFPERI